MIQIVDLSKSYGSQILFDGVSFTMSRGERLGLVGRNGHGKTTLLKILAGLESPDAGQVLAPSAYRIGHLSQHLAFKPESVLDEGCRGLPPDEADDRYKVERILCGLGFSAGDLVRPVSELSGGFHIRLALAKVLVSRPDLLLLDEPTNYLDIVSLRWLAGLLRTWRRELIVVTHDRGFMDSVTTHTLGIHRQRVRKVKGGTAKLYEQLADEEAVHERTRQADERKRREIEQFVDRFRAQARRASLVQSRLRTLERMPARERLSSIESMDFRFSEHAFPSHTVMEVRDLAFRYAGGPPLIDGLSLTVGATDRVAVVGANGRGKSTLMRLLAAELAPGSGTVRLHPETRVGCFGQTNVDRLCAENTVEEEVWSANPALGRTQVRGICGVMMFDGERAEKRVKVLSGGERSRTLLARILAQPSNLLLLDEPTSHLDMDSTDALVDALERYRGAVVMVTHSESILRTIARRLIVFQRGRVEAFDGSYDEFLEKLGWEGEGDGDGDGKGQAKEKEARAGNECEDGVAGEAPSGSRRDERRRRSEITRERSRVVGPLRRRVAELEDEITSLERRVAAETDEMIVASRDGRGERIAELGRSLSQARGRIDELFDELERATVECEREEQRFDALLGEPGATG
jgi:ATP-binding cassette subfamily F protein 3